MAARVVEPVRRFLAIEAAGGLLLMAATVVALAWANSPWRHGYVDLWQHSIRVHAFGATLHGSLDHAVNDGLMVLFFFVVGLEIKREMVVGELRDRRTAALPAIAALGGMVVPALIFVAWNAGTAGSHGWGIPMATDIAFALGVITLLGERVPNGLKLFLLTLAIVDDIGAIVVIAVFYASDVRWAWGAAALALVGVVLICRAVGVSKTWIYVIVGLGLWFVTWRSGVHATVAGVVLGLLTPAEEPSDETSVAARLEERLHPWTSYVIVPIFALANAGVALGGGFHGAGMRVLLGVGLGLLVGKVVGVAGATWLAVRLGLADLPEGARWGQVVGVACVAGIGFTMSLFVTDLAFAGPETAALVDHAKVAVLCASVVAAAIGAGVLAFAGQPRRSSRG